MTLTDLGFLVGVWYFVGGFLVLAFVLALCAALAEEEDAK